MTVDELQVLITANTNELRKEINKANQSISGLKMSATKSAGGVTTAFKKLKTGIVALGIGKAIKDSIQSGMDAIESDSLFETVMGDNADAVKSWSNDIADALGISAVNMQKNIGVIYNMTSSMGVAENSALKMSKGISLLSEDMASFYNLDSDEAFNKLRAGLTGETEPLKALGILVDENTIKQYAYSEGIAETGAELTNEQKVLARYVAILKQTDKAQGDLAKTINSPSNQLRILKQQVTNLGIALSNYLMPVVSAVLPYLTAFTKVATQAVTSLAKFLGLGSNGSASDETETISENVDSVSSGLDDATTSAKKLKSTLAGFDEMNVLQDNSSDSTGTSSGGTTTVGLDFDLSEYDAHLDWVDSNTNALVEKIQGMFASIGAGIDFSNLTTAFDKLKKAVEPLTSKIWDGLKWAWDNILVPLSQWTIGEAVPAFMNALSGALEFLNPFLETFMTLGGWLWDSFLQPIAEWTGGVIVDVLNGAGDALTKIGDWASKNQGVIDTMVASFATFFGLWKLTELMAFIEMSGGLKGAFTTITKAIEGCTLAKLKDKWETIELTAMYAKEFLKSVVNGTVAIAKQIKEWVKLSAQKAWDAIKTTAVTVAQTIWNALSVVGTAVTTALGAAFTFLTSPIGLVILAIGAVIAIVVLCIKHWDKIKETVTNVATAIKDKVVSAFEIVKEKMSSIWESIWSTIKGIVNKIIGGIESMINTVIKGLNKLIEPLAKVGNTILDAIGIKGFTFKTINEVQLPRLARGGIVDSPTIAEIGEAGKEAVIPLERNTGWIDQLADKIGEKIGGTGGNIKLIVKLGEEAIFDRFIEYGKEKAFETNGEVVFI